MVKNPENQNISSVTEITDEFTVKAKKDTTDPDDTTRSQNCSIPVTDDPNDDFSTHLVTWMPR